MSDDDIAEVIITGSSAEWLADFTGSLVEGRLAACGQNIAAIRSIYRWQGAIEDEAEARVALHNDLDRRARRQLARRVRRWPLAAQLLEPSRRGVVPARQLPDPGRRRGGSRRVRAVITRSEPAESQPESQPVLRHNGRSGRHL